ncbi:sporozoite protein essential for cell traversal (SPECT1) [Plasmodium ovale wallikeri]|uniref:Sporozoite protein essential for cell traversal (SPECT1) n=1 Tax=Plasmodium ovale wallikeri TaxID=864142 RepID=A0A1A8ZA65_PLAOA|nr:sporozoite protein essential for cell traversal (SPECT1) [Plasmodium ovale wallikeri]
MELPILCFLLLTLLKCALSLELSKNVNTYTCARVDCERFVEDLEKILEDFSNDINTTKDTIKNLFLDVEASFEEVSDDIAKSGEDPLDYIILYKIVNLNSITFKTHMPMYPSFFFFASVSKYSFSAEEKLNILGGITRQFVENNRSFIYNSSESKRVLEREAFKKVCDLILNKLKNLVQLNTINNYHILLKFGRGNVKKETLETVKNDSNISDELRKEFLKYNRMKNQDVKVTELINFMTPIYDKLISQLNQLIRELSIDLNKILQ